MHLLTIIELIILLFFVVPLFHGIMHPGIFLGIFISAVLLFFTFFNESISEFLSEIWGYTLGRIAVIGVGLFVLAGTVYAVILSILMICAIYNKPEKPQAVIVLGCKVKGEKPSRMLRRRLDAAVSYLKENEEVICVVSGGKGDDEKISEAQAMRVYLVGKGIEPERITEEDKSVNTYQNIEYSLRKIEMKNGEIAIVTDGFHQYRAGYIAKSFGVEASSVNADTDLTTLSITPAYWLREWLAITNEYIKNIKTVKNR